MVSRAALGVVGAVTIVLIAVIIYFANRTSIAPECLGTKVCPDEWIDSGGKQIHNVQQVCLGDGTLYKPNVGPGHCVNPCAAGEVPCWDKGQNVGQCVTGDKCPVCFTSEDCGGAAQGACMNPGDPAKSSCTCVNPPYSGTNCQIKGGCKSAADCGPNSAACTNGVCVCKQGWDTPPGGDPCSVCKNDLKNNDAWGPPGTCLFRRFAPVADTNGLRGAILPAATNATSCNYVFDNQPAADMLCKAEFGQGASSPAPGSPAYGNYFCDGSDANHQPNACSYCGIGTSGHQPLCWVPGGYYSSESSPPVNYKYCDVQAPTPTSCGAPKPPGYKGPYVAS